ncbi:MAG: hypothetical protein QMD11_11515 [Smithella sp.]|nr:hypothetical protein [Smithella sp.]
MKKIVMLGILSLLMMLPGLSLARTAITDADLDAVTAAAGVSIDFTNVIVSNVTLTSVSWGDPSGFIGYPGEGHFGLGKLTITGKLATMNGTMKMDIGTLAGETKVFITLPTLTLGDPAGVIQGTLMAHTSSDFSSGTPQEGGILTLRGFSAQITGDIAVYAHD